MYKCVRWGKYTYLGAQKINENESIYIFIGEIFYICTGICRAYSERGVKNGDTHNMEPSTHREVKEGLGFIEIEKIYTKIIKRENMREITLNRDMYIEKRVIHIENRKRPLFYEVNNVL